MNHGLGPFEWCRLVVVGLDELINGVAQLFGRGKAHAPEGLLAQNAELAFHLIQP